MKIALAGSVGIGKSTMARALGEYYQMPVSYEEVSNNPYLEQYYQDFARWSFHLQMYFMTDRVEKIKNLLKTHPNGFIQDRSIYEDIEIFAKMLLEQGNLTKEEFMVYSYLFNDLVYQKKEMKPDVIVYLTGDFKKVLERIRNRGRAMEQNTPIEFWMDLHERYEKWHRNWDMDCRVVRIDIADYDLLKDPSTISHIINKIEGE